MGIEKVILLRFTCEVCGHSWIPHIERQPVCCANRSCNSPHWNRPRHKPKGSEPRHHPQEPLNHGFPGDLHDGVGDARASEGPYWNPRPGEARRLK